MNCPTCGIKLEHVLRYCNHCGGALPTLKHQEEIESTHNTTDTLMWVVVGTTITILGMALGALVLINEGKIDAELGRVFVILSFVMLLMVEGILVWRLLQVNKRNQQQRGLTDSRVKENAALDGVESRLLSDPGEPVSTVTEQTTRDLEPSYKKDPTRLH